MLSATLTAICVTAIMLMLTRTILDAHFESRELGLLGQSRVNVPALNLALDAQFGGPPPMAGRE